MAHESSPFTLLEYPSNQSRTHPLEPRPSAFLRRGREEQLCDPNAVLPRATVEQVHTPILFILQHRRITERVRSLGDLTAHRRLLQKRLPCF